MHEPYRVILPELNPSASRIVISGKQYHYLANVLRVKHGEEIVVLNGKGLLLKGIITSITRNSISLEHLQPYHDERESPLNIILLQGILKADKMDFVIQKTTELGVREIYPVITTHSIVRYTKKLNHWRAVATEATRQCRRAFIPVIHPPTTLQEAILKTSTIENKFLLHEGTDDRGQKLPPPQSQLTSCCLLIGPEGGFTEQEVQQCTSAGFRIITLGPRVLRSETAAIAATAILQYIYGDFNYHCQL